MADESAAFRIAFVPGVTLHKWTRAWQERHPEVPLEITPGEAPEVLAGVRARTIDLAFVRLPIDRDGLSVVRLYGEVPMVVLPREHGLATRSSVTDHEADEIPGVVAYPPAGSVKDAVALVAAGVGALRLPHSLARLHARKDVAAIPVEDAAETDIAVVWLADSVTPAIEEFVGVVRGRTAASSRNATLEPEKQSERKTPAARKAPQKPHRITGNRAQARNRKGRGGR